MLRGNVFLGAIRAARLRCRSECLRNLDQTQQPCIWIQVRQQSTKPPPSSDQPDIERILTTPKKELIRDVYMSKTGEELLTVEADAALDSSFDWGNFERRLGLDKADDEIVDEGWERLQEKYQMNTKTIDDNPSSRIRRTGAPKDPRARFTPAGRNFTDMGFSVEYCDGDPPEANMSDPPEANLSDPPEAQHEGVKIKQEKSPKQIVGSLQHAAMGRQSSGSDNGEARMFSDADVFRQPVNRKRPGYERRVMSMEREMEKIAVDVLCKESSLWYTEGADVERVLLSPNMKNLTVYYTVETGSTRPASWWRKTHAKSASSVRAAFAQRLETKYVPRVYFEEAGKDGDSGGAIGNKSQLDALFDQIATERAAISHANELDVK